MPNIKDQSGVLLLLSIVMTTVILTAALILSTLIIREIRVSQISDKGQIALFAAESAAEDVVFQILQQDADPADLDGDSGSFSTGATWSRSVSNETNEFVVDYIPPNRSEVINLYNRSKGNARAEVSSLSLSWSSGTSLAIDASTWDGSALSALSPLQTFPCAAGSCSASVPLDPTKGYALVFTAEGTAITDLIISLAPANNLVETAVTVKVVGEYRGAEQALEIILPEPPPWESTPEAPEAPLTCGDRVLDAGEDCDPIISVDEIIAVAWGAPCPIPNCDFVVDAYDEINILDIQYVINFNSQVCSTIEGYAGGQTCNTAICSWDACVSPENCGDGTVNGTETCEPPNTATCDATCQTITQLTNCEWTSTSSTEPIYNVECPDDSSRGICNAEKSGWAWGTEDSARGFSCYDNDLDYSGDFDYEDSSVCVCESEVPAVCGDGTVSAPEVCDDGDTTDAGLCLADCSGPTYCGDNTIQDPNGEGGSETCDDGDTDDRDICTNACTLNCGDGELDDLEQCDPAMSNNFPCSSSCYVFSNDGDLVSDTPGNFHVGGWSFDSSGNYVGYTGLARTNRTDFDSSSNQFYNANHSTIRVYDSSPSLIDTLALKISVTNVNGGYPDYISNSSRLIAATNNKLFIEVTNGIAITNKTNPTFGFNIRGQSCSLQGAAHRTYICTASTNLNGFDRIVDITSDGSKAYIMDLQKTVRIMTESGGVTGSWVADFAGSIEYYGGNIYSSGGSQMRVYNANSGAVIQSWTLPANYTFAYQQVAINSSGNIMATVRDSTTRFFSLNEYTPTGTLVSTIP